MLKRRAARVITTGFLLAVTVSGLTACRTSPNVAAYVGDAQVTVAELDTAVEQRLADPAVAAFADGREPDFTRQVLTLLVQEEVYAAAAQRYDVQVADDDVRGRIEQLLGGQDPAAVYAQLAERGIGRADVFENVRQQLLRQRIAAVEGLAEGVDEAALRARYEEVRPSLGQVQLGYITVPDQATADRVLAQLTADPAAYPQVAAQYPGTYTLPAVEARSADQVPTPLADAVAAAAPGTGFTVPIEETGGIVVGFVAGTVYPSFEEVRPQLEQEAASSVDEKATKVVDRFRSGLDVTVNPRFGKLDEGGIRPLDGGVVDLLDTEADAGSPTVGSGGPGN